MTTNMLGKVVAGAALGGASLLAFAPGIAFADDAQGGEGHHQKGKVITDPYAVRAGHDVKFVEICAEPQEQAFVWSEVTGKVKLHSRDHDKEKGGRHDRAGQDDEGGRHHQGDHGGDRQNDRDGGWSGHGSEGGAEDGGWSGHGSEGGQSDGGWSDRGGESPEDSAQPGEGKGENGGRGGGDEAKKEDEAKKKAEEEARRKKAAEAEAAAEAKAEAEAEAEAEAAAKTEPYFVYYGKAKVPADTAPGTYELKGSCGKGTLTVLPEGAVDGGDGGATGTDRGVALGGATMLGAAALGGIVLMRRRRTDESLV